MRQLAGAIQGRGTRFRSLVKDQGGVTGLETAIILIAFVVVASVVANGTPEKTLSLAETTWTDLTNVTSTRGTVDKKEGTYSADIEIGTSATTGLMAYEDLTATIDISSNDSIQLWAKSSVATDANDLHLVIDDSAGCDSSLEDINLPAFTAGSWKRVVLAIADNSDMTAVKCVGLKVAVDKGAQTVNLDAITAPGQITSLEFVVTNGVGGEAVDMRAPSDSDADGISDSDSKNTMVLTYTDKNQVVAYIFWSKDFIGDNDSDDLLESLPSPVGVARSFSSPRRPEKMGAQRGRHRSQIPLR